MLHLVFAPKIKIMQLFTNCRGDISPVEKWGLVVLQSAYVAHRTN